jgi:HPt (histidine-containing phosphotransfer) domain-containing protein
MPTDAKLPPIPQDDSAMVIDMRDGLERIMGDRPLYARMLARFRDDYKAGTAPILHALSMGERELAHRVTHTMMGAAGMIGARRLHAQAAAAERAIRTENGHETQELARLEPELAVARRHIDTLIAAMPAAAAAVSTLPPPAPALRNDGALIAQLAFLLEKGDGAAVDLLESSRVSLQVVLGDAALAEMLAATHEFDFVRALTALRRAA